MFPEKEGLAKARPYTMKREVTKALTNICRGATEKLKKVFGKAVSPDHFDERRR
jgi:hypothetical protein